MNRHSRLYLTLLLPLALAAGCEGSEHRQGASQVAAKVNGDEITVYQVNSLLARSSGAGRNGTAGTKTAALERLINLQLASQKAVEEKLDRSPEVVLAIENAKTEILARAHLSRIAAAHPAPSAEQVNKYYSDHPELFAQRQVYNI